jgi:cytochrome b involved in lipid metabolism
MEARHTVTFVHEKKTFKLKYHDNTTESELATVILYLRDIIKALFDTEKVDFLVKGEKANMRTILDNLNTEIAVVTFDENAEAFDSKPVVIYINKKNQLIRVSQRKQKPNDSAATRDMKELHEILSFDINKLDQKEHHDIESDKPANENLFKEPLPVIKTSADEEEKKQADDDEYAETEDGSVPKTRMKVPIKDGVSQQKFVLESLKKSTLVTNPNQVFYTMEEVAKHKKADDCWTVWQGKVYDITSYIKSHPGGKKIMAGAGKD